MHGVHLPGAANEVIWGGAQAQRRGLRLILPSAQRIERELCQ
jgi:hypothetical protein